VGCRPEIRSFASPKFSIERDEPWKGEAPVETVWGTKFDKTDSKELLVSVASSSNIIFKVLNMKEHLLINSLTESNSTIGLCKNS